MFDNFGYGNPTSPPKRKNALLDPNDYDLQMDDASQAALDRATVSAPQQQKGLLSFWQGGDKFTTRDAIGGLLAAVGDAFAQQGGGQPAAVGMLTGGRAKAIADANAAAKAEAQRQQLINAGIKAGRTPEEMSLVVGGAANFGDFKQPAPNDTERDYQFMMRTVGKDVADNWLRSRGDPLVNMTLPNNQFYSGPQSGLQAALGGFQAPPPPARPVGKLTPIGGPQGNPAGGFRR